MKQQLWLLVMAPLMTLVVTFFFNYSSDRIFQDRGRVWISRPVQVSGTYLIELNIENWNSKALDGLILAIPVSIPTTTIISSDAISIADVPGYSGSQASKRISFGGIPSGRNVHLLIPVPGPKSNEDFALLNARQLNLENSWTDSAEDPVRKNIRYILATSVVYAIFVAISSYFLQAWLNSKLAKERVQREELSAENVKVVAKIEELTNELKKVQHAGQLESRETRSRFFKYRLYLLARISDYSQELAFWRDTVRKTVSTSPDGNDLANQLISSVTATLKTYQAQERLSDDVHFLSVLAAAKLITGDPPSSSDLSSVS